MMEYAGGQEENESKEDRKKVNRQKDFQEGFNQEDDEEEHINQGWNFINLCQQEEGLEIQGQEVCQQGDKKEICFEESGDDFCKQEEVLNIKESVHDQEIQQQQIQVESIDTTQARFQW